MHLWRVDLEAIRADESRWQEVLSPDEATRASRFHFRRDRQRFVASRALLRTILAGYLRAAVRPPTMKSFAWMWLIGLVAGFLVGITSVGSGSIVMMMLLLFYSFQPKVMVGTDIVHALILTGVTSLPHFRMHNVDTHLVGALLIGSIPGGLFGSYLSTRVPVPWLRRILCAVLLATGAHMPMA